MQIRRYIFLFLLIFLMPILTSCGSSSNGSSPPGNTAAEKGSWSVSGDLFFPEAGDVVSGSDVVSIDSTHADQGYLIIQYKGENEKVKLQITGDDQNTYTYNMTKNADVFPLTCGSGHYLLNVYENVSGTKYALAYSQELDVNISDELRPFLYPNQLVWYTRDSEIIALSQEVVKSANNELEAVQAVYNYLISSYKYDYEKAENVQPGYIPDIPEVLEKKTGICYDYAVIMTAMLRCQNIPTRMEFGFCGDAYHAWVSVYVKEKGWLNGVIECTGDTWNLEDPTFASTSKEPKKFTADQDKYLVKYIY